MTHEQVKRLTEAQEILIGVFNEIRDKSEMYDEATRLDDLLAKLDDLLWESVDGLRNVGK